MGIEQLNKIKRAEKNYERKIAQARKKAFEITEKAKAEAEVAKKNIILKAEQEVKRIKEENIMQGELKAKEILSKNEEELKALRKKGEDRKKAVEFVIKEITKC